MISKTLVYFASKKVSHVCFLGGEPLVRKDLPKIIEKCIKLSIVPKVATNCTLLSEGLCESLATVGLRQIQISLEGHAPEISDPVRGKGTFDKVVQGIWRLRKRRIWTAVSLTLSRENVPYLDHMYERFAQLQIDQLKFAAFVPIGTGARERKRFMLRDNDVKIIRSRLPVLQAQFPSVKLVSAFLPDASRCKDTTCGTFGCGAGTNSLVINNDMSLSACDILTEEDRTLERISDPSQIQKIWRSHEIFKKWRGESRGRTRTIDDFTNVHQKGCQVAYATYGKNILADA